MAAAARGAGRLCRRDWSAATKRLRELLRGRLGGLGPMTAPRSRAALGLARADIEPRLLALEAEGFALRGRFTPGAAPSGRRMVRAPAARAHPSLHARSACGARSSRSRRATSCASCSTGSASAPRAASAGPDALAGVLGQLEGFEAPAAGVGEPRCCRRASPDYASPGSTSCAPPAASPGRACGRVASEGRRRRGDVAAHDADPAAAAPRRRARGAGSRPRAATTRARLARARASPSTCAAHGASFFDELADAVRLLPAEIEDALARAGRARPGQLRQLRRPARAAGAAAKRATAHRGAAAASIGSASPMPAAGRWSGRRPALDAATRTAAPTTRDRARRAHPAAPLRRRLLAPARARGGLAAAVARAGARLSPARGARRNPRRPLRRRPDRRAVRAARGDRGAARGAAPAGRRRLVCVAASRSGQPARHGVLPGPKVARVAGARVLYRDGVPVATQRRRRGRVARGADAAERATIDGGYASIEPSRSAAGVDDGSRSLAADAAPCRPI